MISTHVHIPRSIMAVTDNLESLLLPEKTSVRQLIGELEKKYEGFERRILTRDANLHKFIKIYIGSTDINHLDGLQTPIKENQDITIVLAIAGG